MNRLNRVLAIGAHPDDIELGCGATLAKLAQQGVEVYALILTRGENGGGVEHDRTTETSNALVSLGVREVVFAQYEDCRVGDDLLNVIRCIERRVREYKPDRVYTMFEHDRHQDHRAVYQASIVACRTVRQILCYETPSSWPNFMPIVYEEVSDTMDLKIKALLMHESQKDRDYTQPDHLTVSAKFRGQQVDIGPAEGFIPYKYVY